MECGIGYRFTCAVRMRSNSCDESLGTGDGYVPSVARRAKMDHIIENKICSGDLVRVRWCKPR